MIAEIFERSLESGGLTARLGETCLHDIPDHTGVNPIVDGANSHGFLINLLRDEAGVNRGQRLLYRTWDLGNLQDRPDLDLEVANRVEPHPRLYFSSKYQRVDFHRLSCFNPTLGIGRRPQVTAE